MKLVLDQKSLKDETGMYSEKSSVAMPVMVPPEYHCCGGGLCELGPAARYCSKP